MIEQNRMINSVPAAVGHLLRRVVSDQQAFLQAREMYADRFSPEFTPFQFIGHDEVTMSSLIGWLLDPAGSHGQGDAFILAFLRKLGLALADARLARVRVEQALDDGRCDIVIAVENYVVVVENKIFAADQPQQLARYFRAFEAENGVGRLRIVYLTRGGDLPTPASLNGEECARQMARRALVLWSYQLTLDEWLQDCRAVCQSERISAFLSDIRNHVAKLCGSGPMEEQQAVGAAILLSAESLAAATAIAAAAPRALDQIASRLVEGISAALSHRGFDWPVRLIKTGKARRRITVEYGPAYGIDFSLEFIADLGLRNIDVGLTLKSGAGYPADLVAAVEGRHGLCQRPASADWPWWQAVSPTATLLPIPHEWGGDPEAWRGALDGRYAELIANAAVDIHVTCTGIILTPDRSST